MPRIQSCSFGKVRNSVTLDDGTRIIHTTNRISAFDCILPFEIPGKAEILQALSVWAFAQTAHIMRNHCLGSLNSSHLLVRNANVFPLEIVVRGFLTGSLWRLYETSGPRGVANTYGVHLPEGLRKNQRLPLPIITPTTKAARGHDMPVTHARCTEILGSFFSGVSKHSFDQTFATALWERITTVAKNLFVAGDAAAATRGLALVDTKYEMGWLDDDLILVDEIHTPDSSRYWYLADLGTPNPRQLSKEFLREEIMAFLGNAQDLGPGLATHPRFSDKVFCAALAEQISQRYLEMFRALIPDKTPLEVIQNHLVPWPLSPAHVAALESEMRLPNQVLICGNGGRDWSLFKFFEGLPEVARIVCAPGKRAWSSPKYAECAETDVERIAAYARAQGIDLVVAGPELPIAQGLAQACANQGIAVLAPDLAGVSLECSKIICKQAAVAAEIPTAAFEIVTFADLQSRLRLTLESPTATGALKLPRVIKYDGLASGKGVVVAHTPADLAAALRMLEENVPQWESQATQLAVPTYGKSLGEACFLLEDCVFGEEISALALCNGEHFRLLPFARDYKRRNDGQTGPNTGGMGTVCPVVLEDDLMAQVQTVFERILRELTKRGTPYHGFLFAGLMIDTSRKAWLLEFNCRLGDPETQVVLPGLGRDFAMELWRTARGLPLLWPEKSGTFFEHDGLARVFVVGASPEYPDTTPPRRTVEGLESLADLPDVEAVPTAIEPNNVTSGGRAFGLLGTATTIPAARTAVYAALSHIRMVGCEGLHAGHSVTPHARTDIGQEF